MQRYDERPQPPRDEELKSFIEQLAEYVGKFGPEAELKTQREQQGNPKFDFLFGGPFSDYYQYCIHCYKERDMGSYAQHGSMEVDELRMKINGLRQQITESERNLKAQLESQAAFRDVELNKRIIAAENDKISNYIAKAHLELPPFKEILDQLNNPKCSKEAIAAAKKWIFDHCHHDQQREVILMYLSNRVKDVESTDSFRLNILYLINDWAHQCQRKKLDPVTQVLSRYVPQMYAFSMELATDPNMNSKLEKLAGVWEGHQYFNDHCFKQLRNPTFIYTSSKQALTAEYCQLGINIDAHLQAMYAGYEQQHNNFAQHCVQQVKQLENELERHHHGSDHSFNPNLSQPPPPMRRSRFDQQSRFDDSGKKMNFGRQFHPPGRMQIPMKETFQNPIPVPDGDDIDGHPFNEEDLIPKVDYYSLPAGIIVPLIPMESLTYEPIGVSTLRMPPPVPPSQRLLESMDAFYSPPISEKLRDSQGWEKNALADFFERKLRLKKIYQEKLSGEGRTLDSVMTNKQTEEDFKLEKEEREFSLNRYIESQKTSRESRSRSRTRSVSRSRSRSSSVSSYRRGRSRSRSRSRSSSSSARSRKSRSPARSRSASPPTRVGFTRRSPSPPSFTSFAMPQSGPLGGDNKGALLMQKMGWNGTGLGAKETGIVEPVAGGEIRDKSGMYRGLGSRLDPFEQYRKQRSSNYHDRNFMASVERDRTRKD